MRVSLFGLSTTPITDIRSELQKDIARNLLTLVYRENAK